MSDAKILIVEDEGIEAMDIQHRLKSLGYAAPDTVFTGEEAIQKAEETRPNLVLMDIMLPGEIDGVTAAEQIRARFDIPVIYLTAYADEATLQRAKITEPYGYIVKPFKERELHITIDMALYKHRIERKLRESEKWLATTLRSIGDAVIATDPNGLITFMNPVAESLTGWKLDESWGKKLTEVFKIISRDTRQPVDSPVTKVIRQGNIVGLANHTRLITRKGGEIPIDDSAAPIKDDRGNMTGVILVFRDITEREKAEEALHQRTLELQRLTETLEQRVAERTEELAKANEQLERDVAERRRAEQKLKESEKKLRYLSSELMRAQETERKRIAGELHDSVAASLGAIKFSIEKILGQKGRDGQTQEGLRDLISQVQRVNEETRRIMSDLRPSMLDDLGIVPAINWFCREFQKTYSSVSIERRVDIEENHIPDSLRTPVFRICQEALNNVAKHSKASLVSLCLQNRNSRIELTIQDNGQGFDPDTTKKGLGLSTMRERTELSGGTCTIESVRGAGTTIRCSWPLA